MYLHHISASSTHSLSITLFAERNDEIDSAFDSIKDVCVCIPQMPASEFINNGSDCSSSSSDTTEMLLIAHE